MSFGTHPAKSHSALPATRVARVAVAILSALALVLGLAPAANAQSGTTRLGNFDFTATLDTAQSGRLPGATIRINMLARNHQSGLPYTPSVLNTYGVTMPNGFAGVSGGGNDMGSVGNHGRAQNNFWGGQPSLTSRSVGRGSTRDGWLTMRIPENAQGGTVYQFGIMAHLGTGGSWNGPNNNIMRFTLPAVATTTQAISVTPSTGRVGENVTLSTRVSANHGNNTPTGTVRFNVDGQTLTANVVNGVATTTTSFATAGSKSVTATYLPANTNQWSGSSRSGTVNIRTEATQTNLTLDPVEVLAGGTVQASASVTPPGAAGEIEFTAGDETVRVPVGANGSATAEIPADTTGEMTVTATFIPADPQRYTSSSDSRSVDVYEQTSTSTEVTVDADPVQAGQATTLTATVSPETAAGTVEFTIDGQTYPATVTGGTATLEHTFNAAGSVVVVADFTPTNTDRYTPSSGQVTVNVEAETTQTALTLDPVEVTAGGNVTASAQITPADAAGQVRFDYGNQTQTVDVSDGRAETTFETQTAGTGAITATFLPADPDRYTESSDTQPVEVNAEATQTALTLDSTQVIEGDAIRASATVTPIGAAGAIEFTAGETTITVPLDANGTATTDLDASGAGELTVTATFIPTDPGRYSGSTDSQTVNVLEQISTATSLTVDTDPARVGEDTTLTANVTPANVAGTVTFTIDGQKYPVAVAAGVATLSHTFTTAGQYPATAEFTPTNGTRYIASSGAATVNVEVETTETDLILDSVEVTAGGQVTATAQITPADAVGQVRFDYGEQTQTIDVADGRAVTTFEAQTAGTGTITATFLPANPERYTESSDSQDVTIEAEATQTELTLGAVEVIEGSAFELSARVTPAGAEGDVNFTIGETTVTASVDSDGTASAELIAETPGEQTVRASFVPTDPGRYSGSTDIKTLNVLEQISTATSLTVGADPARAGEETTLTANVTPANVAGTVTFTIDGQEYPVTVVDSVATLDPTFATAGEHPVTAEFTPADTERYLPSSDQVTVNVQVEATQTALTLDPVEVTAGGTVLASATVTPAGAEGTVEFTNGQTTVSAPVDATGTATAELPAGTAGEMTVTATFTPVNPERYSGSSAEQTVDITAEATQTALTLDPVEVTAGGSITATARVTPADAVGRVEFTVGGQTSTVDLTSGTATAEFTFDTAGEATVIATFIPADPGRYTGSSDEERVTVKAEATRTVVTVNADPARVGEETTLTATVNPAGAAGTVTFTVDGDSTPVEVVDGVATLSHTFTDVGQFPITAEFTPANTDRYTRSIDTQTVDVHSEAVATPTTVELDAGTAETGEEITLTATVNPSNASGQVRFTVDGVEHLVPVVDGVATLVHVAGERGSYTVRAEFVPADPAAHAPSDATETLIVGDDEAPGTDPGESTTGSLSLIGLIGSIGISAVLHSSGSLGS